MLINTLRKIRPSRLDLYLISEVLGSQVGACLFIIFFLLLFQILRIGEFLVSHGVGLGILAKMCGFLIITFLPMAIPLSFLVGLLMGFSRLSNDSEVVALKTAGLSMTRISVPIFALAGAIYLLLLQLNQIWVPWSVVSARLLEDKIARTKVTSIIKEGAFTSGFFDMLIYAEKVVSDENRLKGVLIFDEREPKSPMTYVAKEAELIPVRTQQELGSALILKLRNGAMHHSNPKNLTYEKIDFESYQLYLKISEGENSIIGKPQMIEQPELLRLLQDPTTHPNFRRELLGEYWRRTALAISPFIFVLLGIGLATFRHRSARVESIWVGLGVALFYWTVQVWGTSAINSGTVSPWVGAQAANLVLLVVGLFAFRKACW